MTKVELYKSRVFVTIIHLCALGQFCTALWFNKFEINRSMKLQTSAYRRLIPMDYTKKIQHLSYWCLVSISIQSKNLELLILYLKTNLK